MKYTIYNTRWQSIYFDLCFGSVCIILFIFVSFLFQVDPRLCRADLWPIFSMELWTLILLKHFNLHYRNASHYIWLLQILLLILMYTFITGTLYRPINSVQINQIRPAQLFGYFFLPSIWKICHCVNWNVMKF